MQKAQSATHPRVKSGFSSATKHRTAVRAGVIQLEASSLVARRRMPANRKILSCSAFPETRLGNPDGRSRFFQSRPQPPNRPVRGRLRVLRTGRWWIAAALPFALIFGFVTVAVTADDKCKSPIGRFAVEMKLDYYYWGCTCMKPALDFRDPCNSMYVPLISAKRRGLRGTRRVRLPRNLRPEGR